MYICPRCKREAIASMLARRDVCSPDGWAKCIRTPQWSWTVPQNAPVAPENSRQPS